jgi:hypothetical protein
MRSSLVITVVRVATAALCLTEANAAFAEAPRACVEAVERGQSLRDKVKLIEAKAAFLACASSSCPEIIQRDCAQWVAELEPRIPTVILTASDASGRELVYARVTVDGEPFVDRLDGIARAINPGIHTLRIEPKDGVPLEQLVVIREAEKYQNPHFMLSPSPVAKPAPAPSTGASEAAHVHDAVGPSSVTAAPSAWRTGAVASISVAAVAAASFTGFAIAGTVDVNNLRSSCSPHCPPSSVDAAGHYLQAADVSLAVGVAALAVATWLYFEWRAHPHAPSTAGIGAPVFRF